MLKSLHHFTSKKHFCPISRFILHAALICAIFFLIACFPAKAQVNIFTGETMKKIRLEPGWYNSITLDLAHRSGNTELLTLRTRFRSDYLSKSYHGFVFGSLQQGRKNREFFTNKGMAHGRIIWNLTDHILIESFVQKQYNESILLNDRNLIGGGVRFAVRSPESRFNLYLGTGAMGEHESISDKVVDEITTRIVRSTNYINWTAQLDERISTSATGYYQVHVRRPKDYRILIEGSVMFRLTMKLSFPFRLNFRYDNEPPTGIQKHDMEIFNGLSYTF